VKKLAIFVEGRTEAIFVERFVEDVAGKHNVLIESKQILGGVTVPKTVRKIHAARQSAGESYFVLIYDCGGDAQVKTRIQEEHESLTKSGYECIIGIRDVRPSFSENDIPRLEDGLKKYIKTSLIPVHFILSVMELEAWFLAEHTHFQRVDPGISIAKIVASVGFDPSTDDMSARENPTQDLDACYKLAGMSYKKGGDERTISALDYSRIYVELGDKIPAIKRLNSCLDVFLC
jgi:hypothetical protein